MEKIVQVTTPKILHNSAISMQQYISMNKLTNMKLPASYACQTDQQRQLLIPEGQKQS
jgi:hypothetical protein